MDFLRNPDSDNALFQQHAVRFQFGRVVSSWDLFLSVTSRESGHTGLDWVTVSVQYSFLLRTKLIRPRQTAKHLEYLSKICTGATCLHAAVPARSPFVCMAPLRTRAEFTHGRIRLFFNRMNEHLSKVYCNFQDLYFVSVCGCIVPSIHYEQVWEKDHKRIYTVKSVGDRFYQTSSRSTRIRKIWQWQSNQNADYRLWRRLNLIVLQTHWLQRRCRQSATFERLELKGQAHYSPYSLFEVDLVAAACEYLSTGWKTSVATMLQWCRCVVRLCIESSLKTVDETEYAIMSQWHSSSTCSLNEELIPK